MKVKHLTKNAISHKLVFLAAGIVLAIIAAFSNCVTSQADPGESIKNDSISDTRFFSSVDSLSAHVLSEAEGIEEDLKFKSGETLKKIYESVGGTWPTIIYASVKQDWVTDHQYILVDLKDENSKMLKIWVNVYVEESERVDWKYADGTVVNETELSPNQSYIFCYGDVSLGLNVKGQVKDAETGMTVPFAQVAYCQYNPWWDMYFPVEGVEPVQADMWGFYTLEGITDEMRPGKVMASRWGYVFDGGESEPVGWWLPEGIETIWRTVQLTPVPDISLADVEINGGQHHTNFVTTYELVKDGKVVESDGGTFNKIEYKVPVGSSYAVYDDGTLHCSYAFDENGTSSSVAYTVKAIAEEGYTLDKWTINGEDLVPGKDYILKANDVMGLASYKLAEQPVPPVPPAPGPTPVNPGGGTAQTGDATPFAAVAMIAIVAALGCGIALRKEY